MQNIVNLQKSQDQSIESMDDNIHMYESIAGYQEGHKTDSAAVTRFDNKQEYASSRYQEPQSLWCAAGDTRAAISNGEVK